MKYARSPRCDQQQALLMKEEVQIQLARFMVCHHRATTRPGKTCRRVAISLLGETCRRAAGYLRRAICRRAASPLERVVTGYCDAITMETHDVAEEM